MPKRTDIKKVLVRLSLDRQQSLTMQEHRHVWR